jgi:hypothetical protein
MNTCPFFIPQNLVLDIDHTLLCTSVNLEEFQNVDIYSPEYLSVRSRIYSGQINYEGNNFSYWGILRPHLTEFLQYCFKRFQLVIIWSAGEKRYVHEMVKILFRDLPQPHLILTREDCLWTEKNVSAKPLFRLTQEYKMINENNTLFIDDLENNFSFNRSNGIVIPAYHPLLSSLKDDQDNILLLLLKWLDTTNVRCNNRLNLVDKRRIFSS